MGKTWADNFIWFGIILGGMSVYLFMKGAAVSEQHKLFRLAVPALGLILCLVGLVMKNAGGRKDAP